MLRRYHSARVGYTERRLRQFKAATPAAADASWPGWRPATASSAEVVKARHCNSGYQVGDKFILDVDGNFIPKLCPPRLCVYAISQLACRWP